MKRIHFIGIGGSGISAIARFIQEIGYKVSGSDSTETPFIQDLRSAGVTIHIGHDPENIASADVVVRSSAIPDDNPEVIAAAAAGIPVLKRADFLGELMSNKTGIAVAGTHGKTTTTAMLAWTLSELGQDPSFIVGGLVNNLGVNAHAGRGRCFIIEADEYDRMFLGLKPVIGVVTNIEHDHPDCYPNPADFYAAFSDFAHLLPTNGTLLACTEDVGATRLLEETRQMGIKTIAYGFNKKLPCVDDQFAMAQELKPNDAGGFTFTTIINQQSTTVILSVPGQHNVLNALAALTVVDLLGLSQAEAAKALGKFTGAGRRFEVRGEINEITIIDDYAHHPTEIRTTIEAARARYGTRRIWVTWQPHTYSRTRTLFNQFTHSFVDADEVIVTEIYRAREPQQDYSAEQIAKAICHPSTYFIPTLPEVSDYLITHLRPGDVLLVLSAGDAEQVSAQVLAHLQGSEVHHV